MEHRPQRYSYSFLIMGRGELKGANLKFSGQNSILLLSGPRLRPFIYFIIFSILTRHLVQDRRKLKVFCQNMKGDKIEMINNAR